MFNLRNIADVRAVSHELEDIAMAFHVALVNGRNVELRVEDLPNMDADCILTTKITEVKIDEELKALSICAQGLQLTFNYEFYGDGTSSPSHKKFYFKSDNASLTVIVKN